MKAPQPHAQGLAKTLRPHRHDHKLLQIEIVVGMRATIEDVHHGNRQIIGIDPAKVPIQRQPRLCCCGFGDRQRYTQRRIGPQVAFVLGAIKLDQARINRACCMASCPIKALAMTVLTLVTAFSTPLPR